MIQCKLLAKEASHLHTIRAPTYNVLYSILSLFYMDLLFSYLTSRQHISFSNNHAIRRLYDVIPEGQSFSVH